MSPDCKRKPGSGGEHLDPGWLFQQGANQVRGRTGITAKPDAGERITHPRLSAPAIGWAARVRLCGTAILIQRASGVQFTTEAQSH